VLVALGAMSAPHRSTRGVHALYGVRWQPTCNRRHTTSKPNNAAKLRGMLRSFAHGWLLVVLADIRSYCMKHAIVACPIHQLKHRYPVRTECTNTHMLC